MRINNNLMAMNTHRQLGIGNSNGAKSMEKLSSGSRINRAGDDAAGLSISEKMRAQIRGLNQASRNAQDGISLIQTAEGALQETHAILQRMRELAVQASNDTNVGVDRTEIQKEMNQLTSEINRIGNTTEFNTQKLLNNGDELKGAAVATSVPAVAGTPAVAAGTTLQGITFTAANAGTVGNSYSIVFETAAGTTNLGVAVSGTTITITLASNTGGTTSTSSINDVVNLLQSNSTVSGLVTVSGSGATIVAPASSANLSGGAATGTGTPGEFTFSVAALEAGKTAVDYTIDGKKISLTGLADGAAATTVAAALNTALGAATGLNFTAGVSGATITLTQTTADTDASAPSVKYGTAGDGYKADLQIGANHAQSFRIDIDDMRSLALKISGGTASANVTAKDGAQASYVATANVSDGTDNSNVEFALDISSHTKATAAISVINDAIESVSAERSKLGAFQNRLDHAIKNLDTSSENLQAAESRIRDVDMAKEMMEFTKNNILQQAAQAMLAQANQQPQGVLQLLR